MSIEIEENVLVESLLANIVECVTTWCQRMGKQTRTGGTSAARVIVCN